MPGHESSTPSSADATESGVLDDTACARRAASSAIWAPDEDVARLAYFGLYALQHRGQESAGIASTDGTDRRPHQAWAWWPRCSTSRTWPRCTGLAAIGHTRYSTTGSSRVENAQPLVVAERPRAAGAGAQRQPDQHALAARASCRAARRSPRPRTTDSEILGHALRPRRGRRLARAHPRHAARA